MGLAGIRQRARGQGGRGKVGKKERKKKGGDREKGKERAL
jgi:hypothetical protein